MAFNGAVADHQPLCDGPVAEALEKKSAHWLLGRGERNVGKHALRSNDRSIPRTCAKPTNRNRSESAADGQIGDQSGDTVLSFETDITF